MPTLTRSSRFALLLLSVTLLAFPAFPRIAAEDTLAEASALYCQGHFDQAAAIYAKLISAEPTNAAAHTGLVRSLLKDEKIAEARTAAENALRLISGSAALHTVRGEIHFREAQFPEAQSAFTRALALDDGEARAHLGLGKILFSESRFAGAKIEFDKAHALAPDDPEILWMWSETLENADDQIRALERYLTIATSEPAPRIATARANLQLLRIVGDRPVCTVANPGQIHEMPLEALRYNTRRMVGHALRVSFGEGKPERLLLDTGYSGILLDTRAAKKFGIQPRILVPGLGGKDDQQSSIGIAETVHIGSLVLKNCPVFITKWPLGTYSAGVMGADISRIFSFT